MTRINVVPVQELSDQWLIAEYRELPRALKSKASLQDAPNMYVLGRGHVKWAKKHALFTNQRFKELIEEMHYRGFKTNFSANMNKYISNDMKNQYKVNLNDLQLNKNRLIEKYNKKPNFYRWTKREKPNYL